MHHSHTGLRTLTFGLASTIILFAGGFMTAMLAGHETAGLLIVTTACVVAAYLLTIAVDGLSVSGVAAFGAAVAWVATLSTLYGRYLGFVTGWNDQAVRFGSDDNPGQTWIVLFMMVYTLPALILGALTALAGRSLRSRFTSSSRTAGHL